MDIRKPLQIKQIATRPNVYLLEANLTSVAEFRNNYAHDVLMGGLFFYIDKAPSKNSKIIIIFTMPGEHPLQLMGKISYTRVVEDAPTGIGVLLDGLKSEHRYRISQLIMRSGVEEARFAPSSHHMGRTLERATTKVSISPLSQTAHISDDDLSQSLQTDSKKLLLTDFYSRLGLSSTSSPREISEKYSMLHEKYHPDRFASRGIKVIKRARKVMELITEAYTILGDPEQKARYDFEWEGTHLSGEDLENAIETRKLYEFGRIYLAEGNRQRALDAFKTATQAEPWTPRYRSAYGWVLHLINGAVSNEGEELLWEAIKADPRCDEALYYLGWIYKIKGELAIALEHFERCYALNENRFAALRETMRIRHQQEMESHWGVLAEEMEEIPD